VLYLEALTGKDS